MILDAFAARDRDLQLRDEQQGLYRRDRDQI
jgi:hypothetical protein